MSKIDILIGRLATRSNCTGKAVISLNLGGEERLKNEIYNLIDINDIFKIFFDYAETNTLFNKDVICININMLDLPEIATKITELLKK
ncbi:MAG: hypothetical protein WC720_05015 [Candidatus Shapirobacteria bacterium]|jgi:hypothetical protein